MDLEPEIKNYEPIIQKCLVLRCDSTPVDSDNTFISDNCESGLQVWNKHATITTIISIVDPCPRLRGFTLTHGLALSHTVTCFLVVKKFRNYSYGLGIVVMMDNPDFLVNPSKT